MSENPLAYIIEDNVDLATIFAESLTAVGYRTIMINDGAEAISTILTAPPHLIMLDLHLPSYNGDEILREIRANPATKDIRVLVASADARLAEQQRGPLTTILNKPVGFVQLQHLARRFLPSIN